MEDIKTINLKWSTVMPDVRNANSDALRNYASVVDLMTQGRVRIKIYWDSELGQVQDTLKMLQSGVADGAYVVTAYQQWALPLIAAAGLPFLTTGYRIAPLALRALYDEWSPLQNEMIKAGVRPLFFSQSHEHYLAVNRLFSGLDDLGGLKIWGAGYWPDMLKKFGAIHVPLTTPQVYQSIQKGEIEGLITTFVQIKANKYFECLKYLARWPFGGAPVNPTVISLKAWDKISPADRRIMADEAVKVPGLIADQTDAEIASDLEFLKRNGVKQITLPAEEITRGIEVGKPAVHNAWLARCKEKGVPGQEFVERYTAKIKQFTK